MRHVYRRSWLSSVLRGLAILLMDLVLSLLAGQLALWIVISTMD